MARRPGKARALPAWTDRLTVGDVMRSDPFTLGRNDKLAIADDLMRQDRIRHIPVLDDDGELCGIITQRDLFRGALLRALGYGSRVEEQMLNTVVVKEAMTEEPFTTTPDVALRAAARQMLEHKIGCLPVLEAGKLVGIVTEADFVRLAAEE